MDKTDQELSNASVDVSVPINKQLEANRRWRKRNPEKYREYMRKYMAKRRAAGKA